MPNEPTGNPHLDALQHTTNARRHGRVVVQEISCSLGELVDLSASGCRVLLAPKLPSPCEGDVIRLTINGLDGPITLECTVRWVMQVKGSKRPLFGLHFTEVPEEARPQLSAIARCAAHNEMLRNDPARQRKIA